MNYESSQPTTMSTYIYKVKKKAKTKKEDYNRKRYNLKERLVYNLFFGFLFGVFDLKAVDV